RTTASRIRPAGDMIVTRRLLGATVAFTLVVTIGAGQILRHRPDPTAARGDDLTGIPRPGFVSEAFPTDLAIPVEVAEVIRDTLVISVTAAGQAVPLRQTTIVAQVSGRIERLPVRESE